MAAVDALPHPFLEPHHDPVRFRLSFCDPGYAEERLTYLERQDDEPAAAELFDWSCNDADLPVKTWKVMVYSEILESHSGVVEVQEEGPEEAREEA